MMKTTKATRFLKVRFLGMTATGKPTFAMIVEDQDGFGGTRKAFSVEVLLKNVAETAKWIRENEK